MTIKEMEKKLEEDGMLKSHVKGEMKKYILGEDYLQDNWIYPNVYGIYVTQSGKYRFFVTDTERGVEIYNPKFDTEEEACEELIDYIYTEERIYQKKHN